MIAPGRMLRGVRIRALAVAAGVAALATISWACVATATKDSGAERPQPAAAEPAPTAPITPHEDPLSTMARDALVPACGTCHRSDLPTAVPGALAVFDLTRDDWWLTIRPEQYDGLLSRARGSNSIPEEDKTAIETFVRRLRDDGIEGSSVPSPGGR